MRIAYDSHQNLALHIVRSKADPIRQAFASPSPELTVQSPSLAQPSNLKVFSCHFFVLFSSWTIHLLITLQELPFQFFSEPSNLPNSPSVSAADLARLAMAPRRGSPRRSLPEFALRRSPSHPLPDCLCSNTNHGLLVSDGSPALPKTALVKISLQHTAGTIRPSSTVVRS